MKAKGTLANTIMQMQCNFLGEEMTRKISETQGLDDIKEYTVLSSSEIVMSQRTV